MKSEDNSSSEFRFGAIVRLNSIETIEKIIVLNSDVNFARNDSLTAYSMVIRHGGIRGAKLMIY